MKLHLKWAALCASLAIIGMTSMAAQDDEKSLSNPKATLNEVDGPRAEGGTEETAATEAPKEEKSILGLPTSNNDGTILGLFPAPSSTVKAGSEEKYIARELADGEVDPAVENVFQADQTPVGAPPTSERKQASGKVVAKTELPEGVQNALKKHGWTADDAKVRKVTVYEIERDGKTVYTTPEGKLLESSGTEEK
jgi:hypothetical protein